MAHAETRTEFTPRSMTDWYGWAIDQLRENADDPVAHTDELHAHLVNEEYRAACENAPSADFDAARVAFVEGYFKLGLDARAREIHGEISDSLAAFESLKVCVAAGDLRPQEAADLGALLAIDEDDPTRAVMLWERLAFYTERNLPPESSATFEAYALKARAAARAA